MLMINMGFYSKIGGEGGIRTLDTLLAYTHFPGVLLQPGKATADNSHLCLGNDGHVYPLKEAWAECLHDVAAHL